MQLQPQPDQAIVHQLLVQLQRNGMVHAPANSLACLLGTLESLGYMPDTAFLDHYCKVREIGLLSQGACKWVYVSSHYGPFSQH